MAKKNYEILAEALMDDVKRIDDGRGYIEIYNYFTRIANAESCASERSSLESDLKKFLKTEKGEYMYHEEEVNDFVLQMSEKIGRNEKVRFQTRAVFVRLTSKLIEELQEYRDPFETAKFVYILGSLYCNYNNDEGIMKNVVDCIKDEKQKRMVAICARIYVRSYDDVVEFFRPGTDV